MTWTEAIITAEDSDDDKPMLAVGPDVNDPTKDRFVVAWHRDNVIYASTSTSLGGQITGATRENPVKITTASPHGLKDNQTVRIDGVAGMTQLNRKTYYVATINENSFYLLFEDGSGYPEYISGGTWSTAGVDWSEPVNVSGEPLDASGDGVNPIPALGPNGEIYIAWEDIGTPGVSHVRFAESSDGGVHWGRDKTVPFPISGSSELTVGKSRFDIEFSRKQCPSCAKARASDG